MSRTKATRAKRAKRGTTRRANPARRGVAKQRVGTKTRPVRKRAVAKKRGTKTGAATNQGVATRKRAVTERRPATKTRTAAKKGAGTSKRASLRHPATGRPRLALIKTGARRVPRAGASRPAPKLAALTLAPAPARGRRTAKPVTTFETASKAKVLFSLVRSRARVLEVVKGLGPEQAERPIAPGKWCVREIVLHLALRDRARLNELESTLRGRARTWTGYTVEDWKRQNAADLGALGRLNWPEALELLRSTRGDLLDALESVPDEPAEVWSELHTFGSMLMGLPPHDAHHGEQIRRWRKEQGL